MTADKPPGVRISNKLIQRLSKLPKDKIISGCLYGFPPSKAESSYTLWTATGRPAELEDEIPEPRDLEVLTEIVPCGIDPIGVFVSQEKAAANDDERISALLQALPENFLDNCDPVVLTRHHGSQEIKTFIHSEGDLVPVDFQELDDADLESEIQIVRVRGNLSVVAPQTEVDLHAAFTHLLEKVSCPYGTFRLMNSDVFFVHTWKKKKVTTKTGWASQEGEGFAEKFEEIEDQTITNIPEDAETVSDLWQCIKDENQEEDEDSDDGFGPVDLKKKKKSKVPEKSKTTEKETMNFKLMMKLSGQACSSKTLNCAPVFHYERKNLDVVKMPLKIDAVGIVRKKLAIRDLLEMLKGCVQRQIHEMGRCVVSELRMRGTSSLPEAFHFKPEPLGHLCSIVYNRSGTCKNFAEFRRHVHSMFMLPTDRPLFRRLNARVFEGERPQGEGALLNPHVGLKMGAHVAIVQGLYTYHHYMQDGFNDDGWGCAYRSLQTLISWFRLQGYVGTPIPTHKQIQKCLVDIGDKEAKFIDSKQWIGSTEVGFVMETSCGVQSRFISVNSGEEMTSRAPELVRHFNTQGTPVMIGGGVLAHTIIGVDYDEANETAKWLILDPHYTGADWINKTKKPNTSHIQSKGWVNWKGKEFWKKGAFYNMCLPQRPAMW